jgi:pimeloyl-ACP methyl ester carboxylesterase
VRRTLAALSVLTIAACAGSPVHQPPAKLPLEPCTAQSVADARCGRLEVFENREANSGRRIPLRIVVLPAREKALPDPVFMLAGGPGQAATQSADFAARTLSAVHRTRDIVLVDVRGTGDSNSLACTTYGPDIQGFFGDFFPIPAVRACRDRLSAHADLRHYTTLNVVADLDDVRAALGYERINVYGTSYGSWTAQIYAQRFPDRLRSVVMKAVAPSFVFAREGLLSYARDAQDALDALFRDCAADATCHAAFPKLRDDFAVLLERFRAGPIEAEIRAAQGGGPVRVSITHGAFATTVMTLLQGSPNAWQLPGLITRAAAGDLSPLASSIQSVREAQQRGIAFGMHLSVMCGESNPQIVDERVRTATAGTFLGDYRVRQMADACREWPRMPAPPNAAEPRRVEVPALLLSGEVDPNTPPRFGEELARTWPNSRHVVLKGVAHSLAGGLECASALMSSFFAAGSVEGLDTSCAATTSRPAFPAGR